MNIENFLQYLDACCVDNCQAIGLMKHFVVINSCCFKMKFILDDNVFCLAKRNK